MPNYCLECGGELTYDKSLKQYSCKSCGLTFTFQQLMEDKDKTFVRNINDDEIKKNKQKEYLKWWLSKKT
jgi:DNA-directed RNA polymerase subunit RPC12/RpoP